MNLVKAQDLARSMSPEDLKKYANGFAPQIIPPWLATGEIEAQMQRNQKLKAMQGAAQGPQPSIKEQIEQKAGLMGLQQAQQQMMQQQQMAQRPMAGPVPEGTPEPETQPTNEVMMASGGLASVPVRFNFDGGGIVAFTSGGEVDSARSAAKEAQAKLRTYGLVQRKNDPEGYKAAQAALEKAQSALAAVEAAYAKEMSAAGVNRPATSRQDVGGLKQAMAANAPAVASDLSKDIYSDYRNVNGSVGPGTGEAGSSFYVGSKRPSDFPDLPPVETVSGPKPTAAKPPTPAGPVPPAAAAPAQGLPAIPGLNDPAAAAAVATALKAPDQASLLTENQQRLAAMGVTGRGGEEQESRIKSARNLYEQSKPSGLDDLIRVLSQAGQYKGLSGTGPAYTALQAQKRADDLKFKEKEMELSNAVDVARRSEGIAGANKVGDTLGKLRDTSATTGASVLGNQMSANVQLANQASSNAVQMQIAKDRNLNSLEVARIQAASANRPGETERIMEAYGALKSKDPQKAEEYMRNIERIRGAASGNRGVMTRDQASDNVMKKIAYESPIRNELMKEASDALKKSGVSSPTTSQITDYLISKEMGAAGAASASSSGKVVDFNALPK